MNPGLTRRSVLMTGAAAVAFGHTVSDAGAQHVIFSAPNIADPATLEAIGRDVMPQLRGL